MQLVLVPSTLSTPTKAPESAGGVVKPWLMECFFGFILSEWSNGVQDISTGGIKLSEQGFGTKSKGRVQGVK